MPTILMLDGLFPPAPDQLVRDLDAVGADACAVYCWRPGGIGSWTRAHVDRLHAAGKLVMGIVVPPGNGGDPAVFLDAVAAMGIRPGEPVGLDIEPPNTPPPAWEETFDAELRRRGYVELDYGTQLELGLYQPDDNEWIAVWIRTGVLNPLPTMPAGWQAWQFVNDISVNGSQYDASIIDRALWTAAPTPGGTDMPPILATGDQSQLDPHGSGAVYLVVNWPYGPKRWVNAQDEVDALAAVVGPVQKVPQALLDRCEEDLSYISGTYPAVDQRLLDAVAALKAEVDALAAAGGTVDVSKVIAELVALGKHLGVDVTTGQPS